VRTAAAGVLADIGSTAAAGTVAVADMVVVGTAAGTVVVAGTAVAGIEAAVAGTEAAGTEAAGTEAAADTAQQDMQIAAFHPVQGALHTQWQVRVQVHIALLDLKVQAKRSLPRLTVGPLPHPRFLDMPAAR